MQNLTQNRNNDYPDEAAAWELRASEHKTIYLPKTAHFRKQNKFLSH